MATAPEASIQAYVQTAPGWNWSTILNTGVLPVNTWWQIKFTTTAESIWYLGMQVFTPLTYQGTIYVDEITW